MWHLYRDEFANFIVTPRIWTMRTARWKTYKIAKTDGDLRELTECEYADLVLL